MASAKAVRSEVMNADKTSTLFWASRRRWGYLSVTWIMCEGFLVFFQEQNHFLSKNGPISCNFTPLVMKNVLSKVGLDDGVT